MSVRQAQSGLFRVAHAPVSLEALRAPLHVAEAGGFCSFEGWVRNRNEGLPVEGLDYEVYEALALKEGEKILQEAREKFAIAQAVAMHRAGSLKVGDMAVWIGVSAPHRDAAFQACRYIIDEIKTRLPVWKREHYVGGEPQWVACHHQGAAHTHHS
ncbi:molybdenum cofactor biosynthesis protein MoaE [Oecophyllibacter saccharovorans]|uniref:Molybdopterin synthase catalytic subunit n=1 Tax=Oecophyllibacter saccharovorans TaxID=2558360 RepID=A0A506ULJ9_9PROT|nr:molybdenum cofactor biosynthesis protein MoaE [Oecophyllibacter saccharovorans]QDH15384.1 molybdenum cofactor biosynthesis protein MoaE [Oecophyllibacter saccharovorans]TPW34216.1 molybdenum cofactor biosynthesis protein MoaE [Oecophyllibacter saccharovorans]TPW36403.1 molybdenum cofactor biosynthesis protein MoaE [Oecophyllibacter saccharovorans]